ncbi:uncharacterized protein LOC144549353 [Carex rostrata]
MVEQEESRRLAMSGPQVGGSEGHETHSFATKNPNFGKNPNFPNYSNRSSIKGDRCSHCKKEGHQAEKCYFLHPHLRPKWWDSKRGGGDVKMADWNEGKKRKKGAESRGGYSAQTEPNRPIKMIGSSEPGSNPDGAGGSSGSDPMQQFFEQFSVWFSKKNSNNTCGPGNREEDWGMFS